MANRIKGITVEIGGDTTKLSKALEDAAAELHRMEEVQNARQEMNRTKDEAV